VTTHTLSNNSSTTTIEKYERKKKPKPLEDEEEFEVSSIEAGSDFPPKITKMTPELTRVDVTLARGNPSTMSSIPSPFKSSPRLMETFGISMLASVVVVGEEEEDEESSMPSPFRSVFCSKEGPTLLAEMRIPCSGLNNSKSKGDGSAAEPLRALPKIINTLSRFVVVVVVGAATAVSGTPSPSTSPAETVTPPKSLLLRLELKN